MCVFLWECIEAKWYIYKDFAYWLYSVWKKVVKLHYTVVILETVDLMDCMLSTWVWKTYWKEILPHWDYRSETYFVKTSNHQKSIWQSKKKAASNISLCVPVPVAGLCLTVCTAHPSLAMFFPSLKKIATDSTVFNVASLLSYNPGWHHKTHY